MKQLHHAHLYGWSSFDEARNVDFNSVVWVRAEGNVVIDPLPLSNHDAAHLEELGEVKWIVVTNSDHTRDSVHLAERTGARLMGPKGESDNFPIPCARWLTDGDEVVPGMEVLEMHGSKTPGELALLVDKSTLITGDLIRAHEGGALGLLPDKKLSDRNKAIESVRRVSALPELDAVLPGDGWPAFRDAKSLLHELLKHLES